MGRVTTQIEHSTFNIQKQRMEGTKFCSLGCLVSWLFKKLHGEMSRFNPDFRHSERGLSQAAARPHIPAARYIPGINRLPRAASWDNSRSPQSSTPN